MWKRAQPPDYEYAVFTISIVDSGTYIRNVSMYELVENWINRDLVESESVEIRIFPIVIVREFSHLVAFDDEIELK